MKNACELHNHIQDKVANLLALGTSRPSYLCHGISQERERTSGPGTMQRDTQVPERDAVWWFVVSLTNSLCFLNVLYLQGNGTRRFGFFDGATVVLKRAARRRCDSGSGFLLRPRRMYLSEVQNGLRLVEAII